MECWTCKSNTGEKRISPGPIIFEGSYWLVEHAYPIKQLGWLVIVLKRHAEALHELSPEELIELGQIQGQVVKALFEETHCEKEYVSCYAETEHFHHVHFHVFAKPFNFPEELQGGKSFALLKAPIDESVRPEEIIAFCNLLKDKLGSQMM